MMFAASAQQVIKIRLNSTYIQTPIDSAIGYPKGYNKQILYKTPPNYTLDSLLVNNNYNANYTRDSTQSFTFFNIQNPLSLNLIYAINTFKISFQYNSIYGSIIGDSVVGDGSDNRFIWRASTGYQIDSVFIDGVRSDSLQSYTFYNVQANHTVRVVFKQIANPKIFTLQYNRLFGTVSGDTIVSSGSNNRFRFTANSGYLIDSVFINGVRSDSLQSYTFYNVQANHTIRIVFKQIIYYYNFTFQYNRLFGTVTGDTIVSGGSTNRFRFTANSGYLIDSVFINGVRSDSLQSYTFYNVQANHTIRVVFKQIPNPFRFTLQYNQLLGTISGDTIVSSGSTNRFRFTANSGYQIDSVLINGVRSDSLQSYTFYNVQANHTIRVVFKQIANPKIFTLQYNRLLGTISGDTIVSSGSTNRFRFTANSGYQIDSVFINGVRSDSLQSYTFYNVQANHTIRVVFKQIANPKIFTLQYNRLAGTILGDTIVSAGSTNRFRFTANFGYQIDSVFINGVRSDSLQSYTFYNVQANHIIRIVFSLITNISKLVSARNFKINSVDLTCSNSNDGKIYVSSDTAIDYTMIVKSAKFYYKKLLTKEFQIQYPKVKILTDNLAADTFTVIVFPSYLDSIKGYTYKVVIKSPPNLNAYSIFNAQQKTLALQLSGGNLYHITINNQQITTQQNYTELLLPAGLNKITVTTDKACQDSFTQEIFVSEEIKLYPNPVKQNLAVFMAGTDTEVELNIFAENGQSYLQQRLSIPPQRVVKLDLHAYPPGKYLIVVKGNNLSGTYSFIKL